MAQPQLSWRMEDNRANGEPVKDQRQIAYQILVASTPQQLAANKGDLWDSGKVLSDQSLRVAYAGKPLASRTRCHWKVRLWDKDDKRSAWSEPTEWTMGLLKPEDWQAQWIVHPATNGISYPWLRRTFVVSSDVKRAQVFVNTPGLYELYLNGQKVGDDVLAPAYSHFPKRMFYTVHDVAGSLQRGTNTVALWLAPGWYQPRYGNPHNSPIVRAQLEIQTGAGHTVIGTDASWRTVDSCLSQVGNWGWNDMGGERWDAAKCVADWNRSALDDSGWSPAREVAAPAVTHCWLAMPPNRIGKPIAPAKIYQVNGKWVIDFGTTLTGWMRLKLAGLKPGQEIVLDYADLDQPKLQHMPNPDGFQTFNQRDIYVAGGQSEDVFCSKFNQHAFRYVVIGGLTRTPKPDEAEALPIMTDLAPSGEFRCSNELFNRIHGITVATYKTQTPNGVLGAGESREKEGYGDGGAFLTGFLYNFESAAYFRKWLNDWRDTQREDGFIAHTAPRHVDHGGGPPWGGQASELARRLLFYYGDKRAVAEAYPALRRYVDFIETHTQDDILRYYCPYGRNSEWFLGDWVSPVESEDKHGFVFETRDEQEFFNNCYRVVLWQQLADFAAALGDQADVKHCNDRLAAIRPLIHKAWFDPEKKGYRCTRQAYLVAALQARIMPGALRPVILKQLEDAIAAKQGHLDTGMLGTPLMLDLLARENRNDLVATMMAQTTYPSWGFLEEKRKVTTWPETWTGWGSQIILVTGTPGAWFYEGLAGIRPDPAAPGFKQVIIQPAVVGDVTWVKAHHDGPYGRIAVDWKKAADGVFTLEVVVPPNSTATVFLPDGSKREAGSGRHSWTVPLAKGGAQVPAERRGERLMPPSGGDGAAEDLEKHFGAPPAAARPWVYWFPLSGNLTREGITADLEAMARVGIGGLIYMEVDQGTPRGPADFAGPLWRELFAHLCAEARRLGLEVSMNNDAGWCGSGGPWITPELSMQKVVWSETTLEGGRQFHGVLAPPKAERGFYRDIAVFAMPAPDDDFRIADIAHKAVFQKKNFLPSQPAGFAEAPAKAVVPRSGILDLSARMDQDGRLAWGVPPGKWLVLRFGHTTTGQQNSPAPESGRGLECDKFSREATAFHYANLMGQLVAEHRALAGQDKTLVATHIDSWEVGVQNWTPKNARGVPGAVRLRPAAVPADVHGPCGGRRRGDRTFPLGFAADGLRLDCGKLRR